MQVTAADGAWCSVNTLAGAVTGQIMPGCRWGPIGAALREAVDGRDALMALQEASFQLVAVTARWGHSPTLCIANTETWLKTNGCVRLLL